MQCLVCSNNGENHHLIPIGIGRNRKIHRWEDYTTISLCRIHHTEIHKIGIEKFEEKYNINLWKECCIKLAKNIFNTRLRN